MWDFLRPEMESVSPALAGGYHWATKEALYQHLLITAYIMCSLFKICNWLHTAFQVTPKSETESVQNSWTGVSLSLSSPLPTPSHHVSNACPCQLASPPILSFFFGQLLFKVYLSIWMSPPRSFPWSPPSPQDWAEYSVNSVLFPFLVAASLAYLFTVYSSYLTRSSLKHCFTRHIYARCPLNIYWPKGMPHYIKY